jgi:hypothetical protein
MAQAATDTHVHKSTSQNTINTTRHDTTQRSISQHNTAQRNPTQHNTTQHNTTRHTHLRDTVRTARHCTARHCTARHKTEHKLHTPRHDTTQRCAAQRNTSQHKTQHTPLPLDTCMQCTPSHAIAAIGLEDTCANIHRQAGPHCQSCLLGGIPCHRTTAARVLKHRYFSEEPLACQPSEIKMNPHLSCHELDVKRHREKLSKAKDTPH